MSGTGTQPRYCTDQETMEELNLFSLPCRVPGHKRKNGYILNVNCRWHCVATYAILLGASRFASMLTVVSKTTFL